jgi:outer membrane receptor protein involved in Fe transport
LPIQLANQADGNVYGFEIAAFWQVNRWCRTQASYSLLYSDLSPQFDAGALGPLAPTDVSNPFDGPGPHHQATARASFDPWNDVEFDLIGRYVDAIAERESDAYVTVDARLAYSIGAVTFSLVGQNLAQKQHREFIEPLLGSLTTEVQRGVYGAVTWRF